MFVQIRFRCNCFLLFLSSRKNCVSNKFFLYLLTKKFGDRSKYKLKQTEEIVLFFIGQTTSKVDGNRIFARSEVYFQERCVCFCIVAVKLKYHFITPNLLVIISVFNI